MLRAFLEMRRAGMRALVIAPRHVAHNVWPAEVAKWSDFAHLRVAVMHGPRKDEALHEDADLYVVNPEGLPWLLRRAAELRWRWPEVLVVDESTKFKHPNTLRFRTLLKVIDRFKRRYILTGKPVPNGLMDLFGQLYILDGGKRLGKFITHFRNRWFYQTGYGGYTWKPLPGADAEIQRAISDITLRLDKREHLKDLPPYLDNVVKVALPAVVAEQVRKLERDFVVELARGTIEAFNAAALTAKLRQMSSGAVYASDLEDAERASARRPWAHVHDAKLDALDALLAEREGSPTLVAYQFVHSAERIAKAFPEAAVLAWLSDAKAAETLRAWNRGEVPLLLVHPASAAHGLNLQGGSEALIWFDPTYDLEHYDQLIARLWRQGQAKTVVNHLLVAADTIDEAVVNALRGKDRAQSAFLEALKRHFLTP
jgi:SNF2 family DNA or RNA helicase